MRLAIVPALHVMDVWLRVLPHLMNGKEHWEQFYSCNQLRRNLVTGTQQLWVAIENEKDIIGCVVTQIDDFPEKRVLRIAYLGGLGFKREHMKTLKSIELWAKEKGCSIIDIMGRKEWGKLLARFDYTIPGVVFRKEL